MKTKSAAVVLLCAVSAGCGLTPPKSFDSGAATAVSTGDKDVVSGLLAITNDLEANLTVVVEGDNGPEKVLIPGLFHQERPALDPKGHQHGAETAIQRECVSAVRAEGLLPGFVLSTVTEYFVAGLTDAAQKEIAKYAAAYSAQVDHGFYMEVPMTEDPRPDKKNAYKPWLGVKCLRFVRYDRKAKRIRLDEIVQLREAVTGDALQVRPLRVYLERGTYLRNGPGHKVSFTSSLEIEATWFEINKGRTKTVFTYQFLEPVKLDTPISPQDDPFRYFTSDWSAAKRLPLPPMSIAPKENELVPTIVTFRVAGAEAGPAPQWLTGFANFLKAKKDDLSKLLGDALKHSAGVSTS